MNMQRIIKKNIGKDTHVRDHSTNAFIKNNHDVSQMLIGEIDEVQAEPLFNQTLVTVKLARLGTITDVAYPNSYSDENGNIHGLYQGPVVGQGVIVGFENKNKESPFIVSLIPYQGAGNTVNETSYSLPMSSNSRDPENVILGHNSGSYLSFNTGPLSGNPGSADLVVMSDFNMDVESFNVITTLNTVIESDKIILTGDTSIELNGNSDFAVLYNELKTAFDQLKADHDNFVTVIYNLHTHICAAPTVASAVPVPTGLAGTADMSGSKNDKVLM